MERGLWGLSIPSESPSFFAYTSLDCLLVERLATGSVEMLRFAQHDNPSEIRVSTKRGADSRLVNRNSQEFSTRRSTGILDWRRTCSTTVSRRRDAS